MKYTVTGKEMAGHDVARMAGTSTSAKRAKGGLPLVVLVILVLMAVAGVGAWFLLRSP